MRSDKRVMRYVLRHGRHSGPPAPFAGKHPTRIEYSVYFPAGRADEHYCGKPSRMAIKRLEKLLDHTNRPNSVYFAEADTKNVLVLINANVRNLADRPASFYECWRIYHPWHTGRYGWEWLRSPWYVKRIKTAKGVQTVYSPMEQLAKDHLLLYKQMIDNLPPWPPEAPRRGRA